MFFVRFLMLKPVADEVISRLATLHEVFFDVLQRREVSGTLQQGPPPSLWRASAATRIWTRASRTMGLTKCVRRIEQTGVRGSPRTVGWKLVVCLPKRTFFRDLSVRRQKKEREGKREGSFHRW